MGIIARQGSLNAIYIIIGIGIGAIANIFIYPNFFRKDLEYLGFLQLFITSAALFAPFLTLGSIGVSVRYYPKLLAEGKEKMLNFYCWIFPLAGLLIFGISLLLWGDLIISTFLKKNFVEDTIFLSCLFLLTIEMTFFRSLSSISVAKKKTDFIIFLNEVYIRLVLLSGLLLVALEFIDFYQFFIFHVIAYFSQIFILLIVYRKDYFKAMSIPSFAELKEILFYGFNTLFDNIASLVVNKADVFMIAMYLSLEKVAIYNLGFFMSTVINVPNRAIMIIAAPILAKSIHDGDFKNVSDIYQKSSLTQLLLGGIIFIIIWLNFDNVIVAGNLPYEFLEAKYVLFFLGISKLVDLIGSVNGSILLATPYFRYNLYFNMILLIITIVLNIIFIPSYGIEGAAIATAISLIIFNIMKGIFLYMKYQLQPFHPNTLKGIFILAAAWTVGYFIPHSENAWLDIFIRSTAASLVFFPAMILLKVSEDINAMYHSFIGRFFKK